MEDLIYFIFSACIPMDKVLTLEDCYDYGCASVRSRARGVCVCVRVLCVCRANRHNGTRIRQPGKSTTRGLQP